MNKPEREKDRKDIVKSECVGSGRDWGRLSVGRGKPLSQPAISISWVWRRQYHVHTVRVLGEPLQLVRRGHFQPLHELIGAHPGWALRPLECHGWNSVWGKWRRRNQSIELTTSIKSTFLFSQCLQIFIKNFTKTCPGDNSINSAKIKRLSRPVEQSRSRINSLFVILVMGVGVEGWGSGGQALR